MDIFAQYCLAFAAFCGVGAVFAAIITETATTKRVGGLTFVRAGRLSLSYCVVREGR
jgi:hypothetical protein